MKKKWVLMLAAALTMTSVFAGCGANDGGSTGDKGATEASKTEAASAEKTEAASSDGAKEITVWAWDPNYNIAALN